MVLISVVLLGRWRALKDGGRWLSRMEENEVEEGGSRGGEGGGGGGRKRRGRGKGVGRRVKREGVEDGEKGKRRRRRRWRVSSSP